MLRVLTEAALVVEGVEAVLTGVFLSPNLYDDPVKNCLSLPVSIFCGSRAEGVGAGDASLDGCVLVLVCAGALVTGGKSSKTSWPIDSAIALWWVIQIVR